ncbi:hypothetical protein LX64_01412 [Chitinophaga skermanii]|uniref:Natural product n=1 Tax=Chitinophaga skermanii TaxID=331697 RepID=A0A327QYC5_9BACT|nr:class I lanthipeptide [Chitinophaga skermanii]RAJ08758.1 hypothetical protein LX64_01412 [Chitinophaga skermanii]
MKKKKLTLQKLSFEKSVVAQLSVTQQGNVKGGVDTIQSRCQTYYQTCESTPYTEKDYCVRCNTNTLTV